MKDIIVQSIASSKIIRAYLSWYEILCDIIRRVFDDEYIIFY